MKVDILSQRKGSNPGGMSTIVNDQGTILNAYFKYCHGSKLGGTSSFVPQHQPIYEAITFELAQELGLRTVEYSVMLNRGRKSVQFTDWKSHGFSNDPAGRDYYFVSHVSSGLTRGALNDNASDVIDKELIYLDALLISDIVGKRQNYILFDEDGERHVRYLDLGCSFVNAVEGYLEPANRMRKKSRLNAKGVKRSLARLKGKTINSNDGLPVSLEDLSALPSIMSVRTLNPEGSIKIKDLISKEEISEIEGYLAGSLGDHLKTFRKAGVLGKG
jgi:hypothetical protein